LETNPLLLSEEYPPHLHDIEEGGDSFAPELLPTLYIDVIVCRGGGGHISAGQEIQRILDGKRTSFLRDGKRITAHYKVRIIFPIDECLQRVDPLQRLTKSRRRGEDIYNFLLQQGWHRAVALYAKAGSWFMLNKAEKIGDSLSRYLASEERPVPALIISTMPFLNHGFLRAAEKAKIPFLLVPTDLDPTTFFNGFTDTMHYSRFKLALPTDDALFRLLAMRLGGLASSQMEVLGFPARTGCCKVWTRQQLERITRREGLVRGYQTVTVVAGAQGGRSLMEHAKALLSLRPPSRGWRLQINLCCGKNRKLLEQLRSWLQEERARLFSRSIDRESFLLKSGLLVHLRGYVERMVELMACSDILITKTGTCSVMEGVHLALAKVEKPEPLWLLLDNTPHSSARHLTWEAVNIPFVERMGVGEGFTDSSELPRLVRARLEGKRSSRKTPPHPLQDFARELPRLVAEMLSNS